LVQALDLEGVCVSSGAACASGSVRPSPTLLAMGDPDPTGAIRFSFGPTTTEADVDGALDALSKVLPRVRVAMGR
jgi:cysteine desulfurase